MKDTESERCGVHTVFRIVEDPIALESLTIGRDVGGRILGR